MFFLLICRYFLIFFFSFFLTERLVSIHVNVVVVLPDCRHRRQHHRPHPYRHRPVLAHVVFKPGGPRREGVQAAHTEGVPVSRVCAKQEVGGI